MRAHRLIAQSFEVVLAALVIWARQAILAKCCQPVQKHILRHR